MRKPYALIVAISLAAVGLTGCHMLTSLAEVGTEPGLSDIENPTAQEDYQPVSLPMPAPITQQANPNSLWRTGARAFFKDTRAKDVGDIITVHLSLADKAKLRNKTERVRDADETQDVNTLLGYEANFNDVFPETVNQGGTLLDFDTSHATAGDGEIDRQEEIELDVAAVVTQVLPNGALAIMGRQELRVNFELRELIVMGVVRREDVEADNSVSHDKIAEMRLAYGGRGTLSDLQQPRWGSQIWDIVWPF